MTIDTMPFSAAYRILNMIAYGCFGRGGFDGAAYSLFLCRMSGLLPAGETLPEFEPTPDYPALGGDDVDHAAYLVAMRLTVVKSGVE